MADSRIINVDGQQIGIRGLDQALEEMGPSLSGLDDAQAGQALLDRLDKINYMPDSARQAYAQALVRELRRFLGQPYQAAASTGLEVKILGQGCSRCEGLTNAVMSVLGELGLAAAVEHVRDIKDIASYGVMGTPALVVGGKVVSVGQTPSASQIKQWLQQAAQGR